MNFSKYTPAGAPFRIHHIKTELEELGFEALYPNRYRVIKEVVKAARGNRKEMIQKILLKSKGVCRKREYRAASVVAKNIFIRFTAKWCSKSSVFTQSWTSTLSA
ncbi:hypothetical protein ACNKHM_13030 [Shigella sonnei]